jgi:hypothetical protein
MTADQLAKKLGCSRRIIFRLKRDWPGAPASFDDVKGWKAFLLSHTADPGMYYRIISR